MACRGPSRASGFTMIEVIVAVALASLIVGSVYTATVSMTGTARRQREAAREGARWERFVEILQRDLRGWNGANEAMREPEMPPLGPGERVLLSLATTTDGLRGEVADGAMSVQPRSLAQVRYVLRSSAAGFEVVRQECRFGSPCLAFVVLGIRQEPKIEFLRGGRWTERQPEKERPETVRVTVGPNSQCVGL